MLANAQVLNFIDGEYRPSNRTFENRSPVTGKLVSQVHEASAADVDAAVKAARAALKGPWGKMSPNDRGEILRAVAAGITKRFEDFLEAEIADTGKPHSVASHLDIPRGGANFSIFVEIAKNAATESFQTQLPGGRTAINYAIRAPRGVVAVVCPWNLPFLLMTWKVAPALACGNAVVVKPSEETPTTAALLGEVMNAAGVPKGVYNVVHGFGPGSAGELLTRHPGVDAITFTGETATGAAIMKAAADGIRPVSFELGGKNPALVFADCDFERAVNETARSVFDNAGQICLQTERVYVEAPIFERFVEALKEKAEALRPGEPHAKTTTIGPVISLGHREKILSFYRKAAAEGARVVTGGGAFEMEGELEGGAWVRPTIWTGLPESSEVVREEIFGPCCHIAPFEREEEAVGRANDTRYGLCATLFTSDTSRVHRIARELEVGMLWVNSWFLRDLRTPFGGSKQSGIGREGGLHSLEFYSELRNVCIQL